MKELEKLCETMVLPVVSIIVCSHLCLWKDIISLEKFRQIWLNTRAFVGKNLSTG